MSLDELIKSLGADKPFPVAANGSSSAEWEFTYYTQNICGGSATSRSDYMISGLTGHFRENLCGVRSSGGLTYVGDTIVFDGMFGNVAGWVYNSPNARPPRAYFLSREEVAPDTCPGLYIVISGGPYSKPEGPFDFDTSNLSVAQRS